MKENDEIFSNQIPIPVSRIAPPRKEELTGVPKKRKYMKKNKPDAPPTPNQIQTTGTTDDIMRLVERIFEPQQVSGYHMVKSFIELCEVVEPQYHKRLAMTLEGLIAK